MSNPKELLGLLDEFQNSADGAGYQLRLDLADLVIAGLREKGWTQKQLADAAAVRAEIDKQKAIESERKRIESEKQRVLDAEKTREANTKHVAKINNEVLAAVMAVGLDNDLGKKLIVAMAKGLIPHIKISY